MAYSTIQSLKTLFSNITEQSEVETSSTDEAEHRQAAVLILIYPGSEELELVLTRRSDNLPHHPGQISLPGGSVESHDENDIHTALREAQEEVGLDTEKVNIVGALERVYLPSGFVVKPIIGIMEHSPNLQADPSEVEEIFSIPLSLILNIDLYKQDSLVRNGIKRKFYFFDYKEYYIWGATASILRLLALLMKQKA